MARPVALDIVFDLVMRVFGDVVPVERKRAMRRPTIRSSFRTLKHLRDGSIPDVFEVAADAVDGLAEAGAALYLAELSLTAFASDACEDRLALAPDEGLAVEWLLLMRGAAEGRPDRGTKQLRQ